MNIHLRIISITTLLLTFSWINPAISSVTGIAVVDEFTTTTNSVYDGLQTDGLIKYFIPLNETDSGVYGVVDAGKCANGAGTCSDSGTGYGYANAMALTMNLYFDLSGLTNKDNAVLDIFFEDLDLVGINDPDWFFESVSVTGITGGVTTNIAGPYTQASSIPSATQDPFTWSLSLSSLGPLEDNVWIQLGFGSQTDHYGNPVNATNTPEYLKATVSAVPVPAAVWLFGTALIGFVGMSRRTAVT